jgi:Ni/Co efflux regulator RcnB
MNRLLYRLMATTLASSFVVAPALPLNAAPVFVPKSVEASGNVDMVKHRKWHRGHRHWRAERRQWRNERHWRRHGWQERRYYDDSYYYRRHDVRPHRYWRRERPGVTLEFSL